MPALRGRVVMAATRKLTRTVYEFPRAESEEASMTFRWLALYCLHPSWGSSTGGMMRIEVPPDDAERLADLIRRGPGRLKSPHARVAA